MPTELRIAIVGCGRMGIQHARSTALLGHKVSVVCDPDLVRGTALGSLYPDCAVLTNAADIRWHEVDAVFVCTPPFARGEVELQAAKAGVPFFLEKPIGLSAAQLQPALLAARAGAVITSVGYMNRYRASVRKARELLQGETVLGIVAHWVGAAYRVPWWGKPELSGGQLNEQCTHIIDLARHLVGDEVAEVNAFAQPGPEGSGGTASVSTVLRFRNGTLGSIFCGSLAKEKQIGLRVFTPRGQIVLDGWDFKWMTSPVFGDLEAAEPDVFASECAAFLNAVRTGDAAEIRCDLLDAMKTQRVVDAARAALDGSCSQAIAAEITGGETVHALDFA